MRKSTALIVTSIILPLLLAASAAANSTSNAPASFTKKDLDAGYDAVNAAAITLSADGISVTGSGAVAAGRAVIINATGTYLIQGTLPDGKLLVNAGDNDDVQIVLNGVNLTSSTAAAVYVLNADKVLLTLAPETVNVITDGPAPAGELDADDVNAAIFSRDDLTINGTGVLIVNGSYRHGIVSKDDLKIAAGTVEVTAVGDGIKGRDMIAVKAGRIIVNAQQDGMQSNNDVDPGRGFIYFEDGVIDITAGLDGIQAETNIYIKGGSLTIKSGGGSAVSSNLPTWGMWGREMWMPASQAGAQDSPSAKGLKAGESIVIDEGSIDIDSSDDAIQANDQILINGGSIRISSGDDAIHADSGLIINNGGISISSCYEGLESTSITINGGTIRVVGARDDGINAAGGVDESALRGRVGQNRFRSEAYGEMIINGGYVFVSAEGDGIDCNGDITMTGGTVIVHGPTGFGNSALDYNRSFIIDGGLVVAAGSAGMAMAPSAGSSQQSLMITFSNVPARELVHIASSDNEPIITFRSSKAYQSLVVSSPLIETGQSYAVYRGGSHSGIEMDGLFVDGEYAPGMQIGTVSVSQARGAWPGQGPGAGQPWQPGQQAPWGMPVQPPRP